MRGIILPKATIQTKAYWATVSMTDIGYVLWPEYCLCVVFVIFITQLQLWLCNYN